MLEVINPALIGGGAAIGLFAGIILFLMLGRRLGRRALQRTGEIPSNIGSLETAVFALMGLLIAFTFSGAAQRFDQRRVAVVDEANAIGTAWLRVDLVPVPAQAGIRDSMRAYVDARIATYRKLPDVQAAREESARAYKLQSVIWKQAVAAVRLPEARPNAELLLMPALNQMFDIATARVATTQIHPHHAIFGMLMGLALAAALLAGYQSAGNKASDWVHKISFATIISLTVYVILDLEYPRLGWIRLDAIDDLLVVVRAGMN
jgi:hypothetical protein